MSSRISIIPTPLRPPSYQWGYVDNGVFYEIFPLDLKGRFYASVSFKTKGEILHHARRFVHNGDILRKVFWLISALVFEHYYNIIKGKLYANHMSGVKASLYDTKRTQGRANSRLLRRWAGLILRKGVTYCGWG